MSNKRLREIIGVFSAVGLTTLKEKGKPLKDKSTPRESVSPMLARGSISIPTEAGMVVRVEMML